MGNDRYRFQIGDFQCLVINDGEIAGNADLLFANAPPEALAQSLRGFGLNPEHIPSTWTCLLVRTPHNTVLIDTGIGSGMEMGGNLLAHLQEEDISPQAIDTVILTHGHADHIGGAVTEAGEPAFPNATYYMSQGEWTHWTTEAMLKEESEWAANFARQKLPPLAQRLQCTGGEEEIVPGVTAIPAPGHTVGHMAVEMTSAGKRLLYLADVALHPIHVEHPDWVARVDRMPEQTVATREYIFRRAAVNEALVLAFHFPPFPSLGRIVQRGDGWAWQGTRPEGTTPDKDEVVLRDRGQFT